jgi:hypothetical protein
MHHSPRRILLLIVLTLGLSSGAFAATGGINTFDHGHGHDGDHGRPSVVPPPHSHGHCGHSDQKPPCSHYKDR